MKQILLVPLDEDSYLHSENLAPLRRELFYGTSHLRAENSANHNRIVGNLASHCNEASVLNHK